MENFSIQSPNTDHVYYVDNRYTLQEMIKDNAVCSLNNTIAALASDYESYIHCERHQNELRDLLDDLVAIRNRVKDHYEIED